MSRPLPNHSTSSMSALEVLQAAAVSVTGELSARAEMREVETTADDLWDQLRVWVADGIRFYEEAPQDGHRALGIADMAAGLRDRERLVDGDCRGVSHHAGLIGHWLLARTKAPSVNRALEVAHAAATGELGGSDIATDLARLIRGRGDGSITDDEFVRILKKATRAWRPAATDQQPR